MRILHSSIYEQVLLVIPVVHAHQPCGYHKATLQLSTGVKNGKCISARSSDQLFTSTRAPAPPHEIGFVVISSVKLKPSKAAHGMSVRAYSASTLTRPVRKSVSVLIAAESRLRADIRQNQSKRQGTAYMHHSNNRDRNSRKRCHIPGAQDNVVTVGHAGVRQSQRLRSSKQVGSVMVTTCAHLIC